MSDQRKKLDELEARVSAARAEVEARGETFYAGPSRIHLASFPPRERWDDWVELDSRAWPERKEHHYMLVPTTCFNCESACGLLAYVDRESMHVRDSLIPKYAQLVYNGFWFAPERDAIQALVTETQKTVSGEVRLKLYKGNVMHAGRRSPHSLYSEDIATFEEDKGVYDQRDAQGFIKLNALRLRLGGDYKV